MCGAIGKGPLQRLGGVEDRIISEEALRKKVRQTKYIIGSTLLSCIYEAERISAQREQTHSRLSQVPPPLQPPGTHPNSNSIDHIEKDKNRRNLGDVWLVKVAFLAMSGWSSPRHCEGVQKSKS